MADEELTCPHPDCDEVVLIDFHLAYVIENKDLPAAPSGDVQNFIGPPIDPHDAHARSWTVGCMAGHVLLTPGDFGCCTDDDCEHDQESYDWDESNRNFRSHDWLRLFRVLRALSSIKEESH